MGLGVFEVPYRLGQQSQENQQNQQGQPSRQRRGQPSSEQINNLLQLLQAMLQGQNLNQEMLDQAGQRAGLPNATHPYEQRWIEQRMMRQLGMRLLEQLMKQPISDAELDRTKSQLKGNLMLGLESTSSRMNRLAKMELYLEKHFTLDDTLNEIAKVSQDDILSIANELFTSDRISTTILRPHDQNRKVEEA